MERTDEGKALRKDYESGKVHHGFNEFREAHIRPDNISNTLSTVTKDNLLCIEEGIDLSINDPKKIDIANCITARYGGGISSTRHYRAGVVEELNGGATGIILLNKGNCFEKITDICLTLLARDYKGFGNQAMTGVIEYDE